MSGIWSRRGYPLTAPRIPLYSPALPQRSHLLPKMSFFINSAGMNFGYPPSEGNTFDGYSLGNEQFQDFEAPGNLFDSDAQIAGPSRSQPWYLHPPSEGHANQAGYQGCALLDASGSQFEDPYALYPTHSLGTNSESRCRGS